MRQIADDAGRAIAIRADVAQPDQVEALVAQTVSQCGGAGAAPDHRQQHRPRPYRQPPGSPGQRRDSALLQQLLSIVPLWRLGRTEEVAELAVYLAPDAAAYVIGSTYFIDGGMLRCAASL